MPALEPVFVSPLARAHGRGRTIELELNERERDLIVNHTFADEDLIRDLRESSPKQKDRKFRFSWNALDDLAGYIAAEANQARNKKLQQEWERIYLKLTSVLDMRAG